jgi:hypothetical protein
MRRREGQGHQKSLKTSLLQQREGPVGKGEQGKGARHGGHGSEVQTETVDSRSALTLDPCGHGDVALGPLPGQLCL